MGKNFSCNNLGQRNKSDFYSTPLSMTHQLLNHESFDTSKYVLEPCCGNNAVTRVLVSRGYEVINFDIREGADFLDFYDYFPYIITNPPFSLAKEFILKCKEVCTKKFALLLPLSYLHGKERYDLGIFKKLKNIHVFTRYPLLEESFREDGKYNTGMMVYMWAVWDMDYTGDPIIKWIDNDEYVLRKNNRRYWN